MPAPKPTIYLVAGCNGAGKTTFAKEFLPSVGVIRFLNADEIARGLSPLDPSVAAFKSRSTFAERATRIDRSTRNIGAGINAQWKNLREDFQRSEAARLRDRVAFRLDSRCARSDSTRAPTEDRRRPRSSCWRHRT